MGIAAAPGPDKFGEVFNVTMQMVTPEQAEREALKKQIKTLELKQRKLDEAQKGKPDRKRRKKPAKKKKKVKQDRSLGYWVCMIGQDGSIGSGREVSGEVVSASTK